MPIKRSDVHANQLTQRQTADPFFNAPKEPNRLRPYFGAVGMALLLTACSGGGAPTSVGSDPTGAPGSPVADSPDDSEPQRTPSSYTISGRISVAENSAIDSDTNDPLQVGRASNNSFETLQSLSSPLLTIGYLNVPGQGSDGPSRADGDLVDGYTVRLTAGQVIQLEFSSDPSQIDVDLLVFDENREVVGRSIGLNNFECVAISESGTYTIAAELFTDGDASAGGTVYQMRIGAPGSDTGCPNFTAANAGIIAGEVIVTPAATPRPSGQMNRKALSALSSPVLIAGAFKHTRPALAAVPRDFSRFATNADLRKASDKLGAQPGLGKLGVSLSGQARDVLNTLAYVKMLRRSGLYSAADPNMRRYARQVQTLPPNDREYAKQRWHYEAISLPAAIETLASLNPQPTHTPIVAVLDSGIIAEHPDLANQLVTGYDFVTTRGGPGDGDELDPNPDDSNSREGASFHGSHVAGTVAAQTGNSVGGAGVAPMARIMPVRVLGIEGATVYSIIQGMRFAAGLSNDSGTVPARKADVINMSLGGAGECSQTEQAAILEIRSNGVIVLAASGNSSRDVLAAVEAPGNCSGVVSVGATEAQRRRASYSNGGDNLDLVAPGGDRSQDATGDGLPDSVLSTVAEYRAGSRFPTYAFMDGTSMAAPHVAGVMALMRFVAPDITPGQIDDLIRSGQIVDDLGPAGHDAEYGFGQINAFKAVREALQIAGSEPPGTDQGRIESIPNTLSLGTTRSQIEFELRAVGQTGETVQQVSTDSTRITVRPNAGAVDPDSGLGTYTVTANRSGLTSAVFANVLVALSSGRELRLAVTVGTPNVAGGGSLGPVYVLIVDRDRADQAPVAQTAVAAPENGIYTYSVTVPGAARVSVLAGTDTDNDGAICNQGEGCGAYPLLGNQIQVLKPQGNLNGIDFSMAPFGGINAQASSDHPGRLPQTDQANTSFKRLP